MSAGLPWPVAYTVSGDDCATRMPLGHSAPLAEAVRDLAELDYDGVEVQVRETGAHHAETLARTVGAAGLKVYGIGTGPVAAHDRLTLTDPSPDVRRHALARLLGAARLAGELRVPVSLGQTRGTFLPGLADMQRVWAERAVEQLAEEAAERGSRLLLEPQSRAPRCGTPRPRPSPSSTRSTSPPDWSSTPTTSTPRASTRSGPSPTSPPSPAACNSPTPRPGGP
ncbi:sugar phosphate isomerase/epimerase family protein [Streptomyces sp. BSE6.1]|uniref:sugar phosphate isomerase/epimerase family protein n=1 Tax=Streptomyces sp. BSE6.1 TaxID=2605730 RepID=UPI001F241985|nr:TIM barrel protein [Streptomyces sp. BSE6.1]